jgi:hypothetical protein
VVQRFTTYIMWENNSQGMYSNHVQDGKTEQSDGSPITRKALVGEGHVWKFDKDSRSGEVTSMRDGTDLACEHRIAGQEIESFYHGCIVMVVYKHSLAFWKSAMLTLSLTVNTYR